MTTLTLSPRWWIAAAVAAAMSTGCAKKKPADANPETGVPAMTVIEIKRGTEACATYLQQVCELAKQRPERSELSEACRLAPALGDAMQTALEVAHHPDSARLDVLQAQDSARKTANHCIEATAKLLR
jgi:hypothetical protein